MTAVERDLRKGWCPGVHRPMQTGDGLIVRIRPRCGALEVSDLAAIAGLAQRYGNGLIDLTRRSNVQLRGLTQESLPGLWHELDGLGLSDDSEAAEAARNVMVSPLAGLDPAEVTDVRALARELEGKLSRRALDINIPGKFGFIVDGGGCLPLDAEVADIRLRAVSAATGVRIAIGVDRPDGVRWLRQETPDTAVAAAIDLAAGFGRLTRGRSGARMARLSDAEAADVAGVLDGVGEPVTAVERRNSRQTLGTVVSGGAIIAVGMAAPFGRLEAEGLARLAGGALALGVSELRVSPWRSVYAPARDAASAAALEALARDCGLIVATDDPLVSIDACPGAPSCASAKVNTRAAARALAPYLTQLGCATAHVSGCSKGCARSKAADVVLVGEDGRFRVVFRGNVQDPAVGTLSPDKIQDLLSLPRVF